MLEALGGPLLSAVGPLTRIRSGPLLQVARDQQNRSEPRRKQLPLPSWRPAASGYRRTPIGARIARHHRRPRRTLHDPVNLPNWGDSPATRSYESGRTHDRNDRTQRQDPLPTAAHTIVSVADFPRSTATSRIVYRASSTTCAVGYRLSVASPEEQPTAARSAAASTGTARAPRNCCFATSS